MPNIYDVNAAIDKPNIMQSFQQGQILGERQRVARQQEADLSNLRNLAPQIIAGNPQAFDQAAAIDPAAAQKYQGAGDQQLKRMQGLIKYIDDARKTGNPGAVEAAYQQGRPFLARFGQEPPATFAEAEPMFEQAKARIAQLSMLPDKSLPTGFQQFEMTARAAGLQPGTPEYQQAANIALGREGRASSAGIGFQKITGADGRERIGRTNPRNGAFEIYNEQTGQFEPMGGTTAPGALSPMGGQPAPKRMTPEQIMAQATQIANQGGPGANIAQADAWLRQQMAANGYGSQTPTSHPGLAVSRSPEETAAATEAAKQRVGLQFLPQTEAIKTQAAIHQAGGSEAAKEQAKAASTFLQAYPQKLANANDMLAVLDKAITSPGLELMTGLSGKLDPRAYMPGGKAAAFNAVLNQIKGKAFLEAYNTLKGGGQITEVEGQKATQAMARLDTAQSADDFLAALKEFRGVVANGVQRLQQQGAQFSGQQPDAMPTQATAPAAPAAPAAGGWSIERVQ